MCGGCCFGNNPDEACGYPPKTIRAFISVTICLFSFLIFAFLAIVFALDKQFAHAMAMVGLISTELGTVIGYYFGSSSDKKKVSISETTAKLEEGNEEKKDNMHKKDRIIEIDEDMISSETELDQSDH